MTGEQNPVIEAIPAENQLKAGSSSFVVAMGVIGRHLQHVNDAELSAIYCYFNFINFVN